MSTTGNPKTDRPYDGTALLALRERVAGLTEPDREVDGLIAASFGLFHGKIKGQEARGEYYAECFTSSIDAALGLVERVLPEHGLSVEIKTPHVMACLGADGEPAEPGLKYPFWAAIMPHFGYSGHRFVDAPTAPLAILLALLDALIALGTKPDIMQGGDAGTDDGGPLERDFLSKGRG